MADGGTGVTGEGQGAAPAGAAGLATEPDRAAGVATEPDRAAGVATEPDRAAGLATEPERAPPRPPAANAAAAAVAATISADEPPTAVAIAATLAIPAAARAALARDADTSPDPLPPPAAAAAAAAAPSARRTPRASAADDSDPLGATLAADDAGGDASLPEVAPDRYVLADEIGRGGLGVVTRARDRHLGRAVAVKALHAGGAGPRRRFVREALITARLEHPSIVPVHDAGRWPDGSPFYAMKLVRGRPLSAVIDERKDLAARLALVPTVLAVCDAVAYAHSERVVHRDLKPHNVLVGEFGETVVIDWGLAKDLAAEDAAGAAGAAAAADDPAGAPAAAATMSTETVAGSVLGTPAYMAPEQALGARVDERADVYALGAMLYHVLVGKPPHDGGSIDEVLDRAVTGAVVPLVAREPGVPLDLAAIVAKAMARAPGARYPTARELAEDLRRFTTGQLVGAHRYTRRQRLARWLKRNRGIAIAVAAATAVVAVIATVSVRDVLRERDRADAQRDLAVAERGRADQQRARADQERAAALAAANRAVLAQARGALDRDAAEALAWLATLAVDGPGWDAARALAADALWRGPPARVLRGHLGTPRAVVGDSVRLISWDDAAVWLWDLATGAGQRFAVERTERVAICDDGRILGRGIAPGGTLSDYTLDRAAGAVRFESIASTQWAACGGAPAPEDDRCGLGAATPDGAVRACADPQVTVTAHGATRTLRKTGATWLALDDDGRWLAVDGPRGVEVYDVATGALRWTFATAGALRGLELAPAGALLVVADDAAVYDLADGHAWRFGGGAVAVAGFLPDGRVVTGGTDRTVRVWARPVAPPRLEAGAAAAAFAPDGRLVVAGSDGALRRVDVDGAAPHVASRAPVGHVGQLAVGADGTVIAALGAAVWRWPPGAAAEKLGDHPLDPAGGALQVAVAADGTPLSWSGDAVRAWGAAPRTIALPPPPPMPAPVAAPTDIAIVPGCASPWGEAVGVVPAPRGALIAVSRHVTAVCDGLTYLVDPIAGTAALLDGAAGRRPAWSPDGATLYTGATDGGILAWDVATRRARRIDAHLLHPHAAAVSRDGRWLAVTGEGAVALVDLSASASASAAAGAPAARMLDLDEPYALSAWFVGAPAAPAAAPAATGADTTLVVAGHDATWLWDLASGERRRLGVGFALAVRAVPGALLVVSADRVWRIPDDLPRDPAALSARLNALGYALPSAAP